MGGYLTESLTANVSEQTDATKLAILNAQLCQDKIAEDVLVINLTEIETSPTDYFVICTCDSGAQIDSIAESIMRASKDYRLITPRIEGREALEWVLIDFFDVVVHIMLKNVRELYRIEKLWGDAQFFTVDDEGELHSEDYEEVIRIYSN